MINLLKHKQHFMIYHITLSNNFEEIFKIILIVIPGFFIFYKFLIKALVNTIVTAQIEKYKLELNREIETVKSNLKIMENERTITFTKLHEERAHAIKDLYIKSLELCQLLLKLTLPAKDNEWYMDQELNDNVYQKIMQFNSLYNINKIYLTNDTCLIINNLIEKSIQIENTIYNTKIECGLDSNYSSREGMKILIQQYDIFKKEIPKITEELINEFRNLLGVK